MQVALTALGCRLNEAELERWGAGFQAAGHRLTQRVEEADLVVVNTCAVTGEAVKKSRQLLRRARRRNARAKLVVSGCYATLQPEIARDEDIDLVVSNADKERLVAIVGQKLTLEAAPDETAQAPAAALFARGRNRAFVKAQDGCRHRCAFCIVTLARGAERSRPSEDIVAEINGLRRQGIREAVLTGVHLGGYGRDLKTDLPALIERVLAETTLPRLRLGSVEPWALNERFFSLFDNPRFMPHLHLPLQSGSDAVLRRMRRRGGSAAFAALARAARERVPDINLTTDVIAGFPGETDEEWRETMAFCRRLEFSHIHVFPLFPADRHSGGGTAGADAGGSETAPLPATAGPGAATAARLRPALGGAVFSRPSGKRHGRDRRRSHALWLLAKLSADGPARHRRQGSAPQ